MEKNWPLVINVIDKWQWLKTKKNTSNQYTQPIGFAVKLNSCRETNKQINKQKNEIKNKVMYKISNLRSISDNPYKKTFQMSRTN